MSQITQEANQALKNIQEFNVNDLSREEDLGNRFSFSGAVSHVSKTKDFYGQLSHEFVDSLPDTIAEEIKGKAETSYGNLINIMEFDPVSGVGERDRLIEVVKDDYSSVFRVLYPLIAYGSSVTGNIQAQVEEFRAIIDQAQEEVKKTGSEINDKMAEADRMLENIRQVSSEHAVSQHAVHFKEESDSHLEQSKQWRKATIWCAIPLVAYSIVAIIGYNWFAQEDIKYDIQLILGKILLFTVLSYSVVFSARNFMSHTHNAITNKHRQNALMTFTTLANAVTDQVNRDIILAQASSCIFSPQDTGYTKPSNKSISPDPPAVGVISKMMSQ